MIGAGDSLPPFLVSGRIGAMQRRAVVASASDQWVQCAKCKKILFKPDFEQAMRVCPSCGHHHRLRARERIAFTVDPNSFVETDADLRPADPLGFPEYADKLAKGAQSAGENEAIITGIATIEGHRVVLGVMDFAFMGGSMGSVVGEKVVRCFERGLEQSLPVVLFCASGGARMQEGLVSLMQMAKTTAGVARFQQARQPYIAVFTDPTMAGVLASFASLADVILAEPGALVGFAGQRVAAQASVGKPPANFQTAEFQMEHGMIDLIVPRKQIRPTLAYLLDIFTGGARV
ncbi:Acetyl-coenzyme A carboxylase carboxyl transferase subunit beta [bacterium HR14]|nr:Acetyl-coenzyme A carboxylase carboxyl transferase subunit beta [bacterium HR14]